MARLAPSPLGTEMWAASPTRVTPGTRSQRWPMGSVWWGRRNGTVSDPVTRALNSGAHPSNSAGLSDGAAARLTREQKGRFVAICWTAQMYRHFTDPKPAYVADWPQLPTWQQETDADIFEAVEKSVG
ncbi:hypothetical protein [Streptomyces sp. NPDC001091]